MNKMILLKKSEQSVQVKSKKHSFQKNYQLHADLTKLN